MELGWFWDKTIPAQDKWWCRSLACLCYLYMHWLSYAEAVRFVHLQLARLLVYVVVVAHQHSPWPVFLLLQCTSTFSNAFPPHPCFFLVSWCDVCSSRLRIRARSAVLQFASTSWVTWEKWVRSCLQFVFFFQRVDVWL